MVTVRFQTRIKDGVIQIPRKYRSKLSDDVRVLIQIESKKSQSVNYIDQLMAQPVMVRKFKPLTREQIYAR